MGLRTDGLSVLRDSTGCVSCKYIELHQYISILGSSEPSTSEVNALPPAGEEGPLEAPPRQKKNGTCTNFYSSSQAGLNTPHCGCMLSKVGGGDGHRHKKERRNRKKKTLYRYLASVVGLVAMMR